VQSVSFTETAKQQNLASQLAETEVELDRQKQMVTRLQQVIDMLQCNAADGEEMACRTKEGLEQKTSQIMLLEEELMRKTNENAELVKQLNKANTNKLIDSTGKLEREPGSCSNSEETIARLEDEKFHLLSDIAELKKAVDTLRHENSFLQSKMDDSQVLDSQHKSKHINTLTKENHRLDVDLQAAIDLQREYEVMEEAKAKELESAFAMHAKLKDELKHSKQATETINIKLQLLERELATVTAERNVLRAALQKKDTEIWQGLELRKKMKRELTRLKKELLVAKHHVKGCKDEPINVWDLDTKDCCLATAAESSRKQNTCKMRETMKEINSLKEKFLEDENQKQKEQDSLK
ncbi:hypothetical protein LSH36_679g00018, partial [Paralvinella palmiformis]